jgi:hypothetical protein
MLKVPVVAAAWLQIMLGAFFLGAAAPAHDAGEEARVLILNGADPYLPAYLAIDGAMRASLANESARRVVFYSEPLDAQRFPVEALESEFLALHRKKYRALRIDVVVAVTTPALDFYNRHGAELWPSARVVFHSVPNPGREAAPLPPHVTGVVTREDVAGTIGLARRLQPDARRILVVSGAAELDKRLERQARERGHRADSQDAAQNRRRGGETGPE